MRIGEIARQAGVSKSIIRYYEKKGILPRPMRNCSGYREYGATDLARIQLVTGARRLGCTFIEIKAIIAMEDMQSSPSSHTQQLLACKVAAVGAEIDRLRQIESELSRLQQLALIAAKR